MACSIHPMPHRPTAWTHAPPGHSRTSPAPATPAASSHSGHGRAVRRCPRPGRGRYTEKTARPRRCGRPARRAPARAEVRARGRSAIQAAPPRPRSPLRARPVRDAFFQHGIHARTEARSLGEPGGKPWSACCFPDQCPLPRSGAPARLPASGKPERVGRLGQRQEYRIQLMPSVGAHPRNPQGQVTLHPIRSTAVSIVPSSTPTPSRRVSRCLSDQFISSDFLLSSFAYERLTSPVQSWH